MRGYLAGLATMAIVSSVGLAAGEGARPKRPRFDLRASPRVAFSPVEILIIAELKGGQNIEEFYYPSLL
jgi:hypothetical protein